jgi:hypothetical protein
MAIPEAILTGEELSLLRSQKGNTCISIIVPLAKYGPEREQNQRIIEKAIQKTEQLWHQRYPHRNMEGWLSKILSLKEKLDPIHPPQSVGFFVAENLQRICSFPFLTKEKIVIGDSFEVRDLLKKTQDERPYLLLTLTLQKAKLYQGKYNELVELHQTGLATLFKEAFEFVRPSRSTSYAGHAHVKSVENEKQNVITERAAKHFKQVDEIVMHYHTQLTPLVVMADRELLALYKKVTSWPADRLLLAERDPAHLSEHQLGFYGWPPVKKWQDLQQVQFQETAGSGRTARTTRPALSLGTSRSRATNRINSLALRAYLSKSMTINS